MKRADPRILTINGGSSSIKFALFEVGDPLRRILEGGVERIGSPEATLRVKGSDQADNLSRLVAAPDHAVAVGALMDWIEERIGPDGLTAAGHRVVHGGPRYSEPQRITAEMVEELHRLSPFDPDHLRRDSGRYWVGRRTGSPRRGAHFARSPLTAQGTTTIVPAIPAS